MPDELLTVKEVADLLKLNQQTIRNMIERGELSPQSAEANPWQAVSEAASTVAAAARMQDRDALDQAISRLADAAGEITSGPIVRPSDPTVPAP